MRIPITLFDLQFEKNVVQHEAYIDLNDNHLIYRLNYDRESPHDNDDLTRGWYNDPINETTIVLKDKVCAISYWKSHNPEKWAVEIKSVGDAYNVKYFYLKETDALDTFRIIQHWLLQA